MRKLLTMLFLGAFSVYSHAQTMTLTVTQAACNNDGIITANFTGFTPPITVTWTQWNMAPVTHVITGTTDQITNYRGGDLNVYAVDGSQNADYDQLFDPPFTFTHIETDAMCPTLGTSTATISGGTGPFTFNWYDITTSATVSTTNPANLPGGSYGVEITDANGCVFGSEYTYDSIGVGNIPAFSFPVSSTMASCTNGTATVGTIVGGVPPYSYLWSTSATTSSISGLTMGQYPVTVTDAQGCSVSQSAYVSQSININVNVTGTNATCTQNNGSAIAFPVGGTAPYAYLWNNTATTQSTTGLAGNAYASVTVTDANGCLGTGFDWIAVTSPVTATVATTPSSCTASTGSATLTIGGGVPPYTTVWNTMPVQTGVTASALPAGVYQFTITDANGCIREGAAVIPPQSVITVGMGQTAPTCTSSNGALAATPTGGTAPYTYAWSNSATTSSITGIPAGSYSVLVTDANGCTKTKSQYLAPSTPVSLGFSTTPASCIFVNDGAVTVTPTGGTAPYTYQWGNGGTTATITGLADAQYGVTVTDANGCTKSGTVSVPYNANNNSCYCTVEGTVYNDINNNCTQDVGEDGIRNIQMHLSGIGYTYTDTFGHYSFIVPSGTYTLSETVQTYYPLAGCQSNGITVNASAQSNCSIVNNFANNTATIHSMHVSTWSLGMPVPGNAYNTISILTNEGTVVEPAIVAGHQSEPLLAAPLFSPGGYYTGGTNDWYEITGGTLSLPPAGSLTVISSYNIPTNMALGTPLVFKDSVAHQGPISTWLTDYTPWNNVDYYQSNVVGSWDPNFKEVSPKGLGSSGTIFPQDSVLEYAIHFQNEGTWYAEKVVVIDTLDVADLDIATLKPIYTSHDCYITMTETGIVTFTFDNIHLPAKTQNELLSHGLITYSIETKPNLPQGTQFTNSAAIYFDYNAPVITNTTLNTLGWPTSVNNTANEALASNLTLYPNPANDMFYARINSSEDAQGELTVVDVSGKVIISKNLSIIKGTQAVPVQTSSLSKGIYFVTYSVNGKKNTQKLVIME